MSGIGSFLVFVIFAVIAVVSKKAKEEAGNDRPVQRPQSIKVPRIDANRPSEESSAEYAAPAAPRPAAKKRALESTTLRDDRKNDWMAKQLREEARIRSATDLGAVHDANCEAREIKAQHAALHRAGRVDL